MIRAATTDDIDELVRIEDQSFDETDRLSRRSFRYMLTKANARTLVETDGDAVHGYALVLFAAGTSMARLYSFAVDPAARRRGIGKALLAAIEAATANEDCVSLRVEMRRDNAAAIALFQNAGYRQFGVLEDYYDDHTEALRFEKSLAPHLRPELVRVPYFRQSLDFTCGPAAVMMAMKTLDDALPLDRKLELRIWRESTTVFMTSGHGGCGPYGLGLSAYHRGYDVEIYVNDNSALFVDSVRSVDKKEVIRLVQEDFIEEIGRSGIKVHYGPLGVATLQKRFEEGGIAVVLISSYRIYHEKFPHWVVVTGFDERFIYVHDPLVDEESGESLADSINMPILKKDFERMARYGKAGQRAALILNKQPVGNRSNGSRGKVAKS
jgi:ribosomal protein S18 acetylase RimI-like enzyme